MMQKIKPSIRLMNKEDVRSVKEIEDLCFSEPWSEKSIEEGLRDKNSCFFIAEVQCEIIGYAGMYSVLDEGYMHNIAVKNKFRGMGVGFGLMQKLFDHCIESNLKFISLEVRASNIGAINLYKKLEFEILGTRKNFYRKPQEDALIMTKYF